MTTPTPHPTRRRRGRPRLAEPTTQIRIRLPNSIYDRICRGAMRNGDKDVAKYVRRFLTAMSRRIEAT